MHRILLDVSNSVGGHNFCSMWIDFHQRTALSPTGSSSSTNAPWRWRLCLVVWSGTLADRLACRPCWCKRFWMVWCDTRAPLTSLKGVVDCFFSRLDCVYGVQSSMCSCLVFLKTHYFSHNLPLFHTSLSLLWQTPRFISWFYEAPPSEIRDAGWDWLAGSVCCDSLNRLYCTSERPAPLLSGMLRLNCKQWRCL